MCTQELALQCVGGGCGGKVLHHITSSFPNLDMCLIILAGWFSLEPVNKKFDSSSLITILTPP